MWGHVLSRFVSCLLPHTIRARYDQGITLLGEGHDKGYGFCISADIRPCDRLRSPAQLMLDVSKITCDQFAGYKITTPQNIAIWLDGYYNGKRSNTVIDMQKLTENTKTLERYCIQNPQILVMNAVETILGEK